MIKHKILIVDDDPDIRDVIKLSLELEDYDMVEASNGEEGLQKIYEQNPSLVILDLMMPKMNGNEVCSRIKSDPLMNHIPVIMLTGKGEIQDKIKGIGQGADDYIVKPFEPEELSARVAMILRRTETNLDANPLTKLPGNTSISSEIEKRLTQEKLFAVCYADLNKFKTYNDAYGFSRGDAAIKETAKIILQSTKKFGTRDDFVGHVGGDDFVFITAPDKTDIVCRNIIKEVDAQLPLLYDEEDRKRGYLSGKDRQGNEQKFELITIAIAVISNEQYKFMHVAEFSTKGAELKAYAKTLPGSNYVKEKRKA